MIFYLFSDLTIRFSWYFVTPDSKVKRLLITDLTIIVGSAVNLSIDNSLLIISALIVKVTLSCRSCKPNIESMLSDGIDVIFDTSVQSSLQYWHSNNWC